MLDIILSNRFKNDLKLLSKRGYNLQLLDDLVECLAKQNSLPLKNRDHSLVGTYIGYRECHIQPDWLLIYRIDEDDLVLFLSRTGTHSDLFI